MIYLDSILTLMTLFMAALISPGPDFALIIKNSLTYSRKTAILTAFGIGAGAIVHTSYILLGIGELLINNPHALRIFTYIGASYLIYIGYKGITAKAKNDAIENISHKHDISAKAAFSVGFITCILNPKAILFITSMFTIVVKPEMPMLLLVVFGIIIFFQTFIWYSIVAVFLSGKKIREKVSSIEHWINRITGTILLVIGIKLLFVAPTPELNNKPEIRSEVMKTATKNKPFSFERPEDSPGFLLWQVTLTWQRLIKEALEPYNIAHSEFVTMAMLMWFENLEHKPTQIDIVNLSRLDKMTLSKALKKLAADGYVTRTDMLEDTRTKSAALTQKGKELICKLVPIVEKIDEEYFGVLSDEERKKLLSIFRKL